MYSILYDTNDKYIRNGSLAIGTIRCSIKKRRKNPRSEGERRKLIIWNKKLHFLCVFGTRK